MQRRWPQGWKHDPELPPLSVLRRPAPDCGSTGAEGQWDNVCAGTSPSHSMMLWNKVLAQACERLPSAPPVRQNEYALLGMGVVGFSTLSLPDLAFCPKYSHGLNNVVPLFPYFSVPSPGLQWLLCAAGSAGLPTVELHVPTPHRPGVSGAEPLFTRSHVPLSRGKSPRQGWGGKDGRPCTVPLQVPHQKPLGGQDLLCWTPHPEDHVCPPGASAWRSSTFVPGPGSWR